MILNNYAEPSVADCGSKTTDQIHQQSVRDLYQHDKMNKPVNIKSKFVLTMIVSLSTSGTYYGVVVWNKIFGESHRIHGRKRPDLWIDKAQVVGHVRKGASVDHGANYLIVLLKII
jgi:hypothetical protein